MGLFENKVALVTGAARKMGIGHATAVRFAREGAHVIVNGRYRAPEDFPEEEKQEGWRGLDSVIREIEECGVKGLAITADVTDRRQVDEMVKKAVAEFGRIDYLVANAGVLLRVPFLELSEADWHRIIDINLNGVFYCCQAVLRHMMERGGGGAIVNVSSRAGKMGEAGVSAYCAAKFGVNGLTQVLGIEFGPHNIRVNSVCPGRVSTDMMRAQEVWKTAREKGLDIKEAARLVHKDAVELTPLQRPAFAEELASVIAFLCSDEASFITGQCINVDGGRLTAH
jgi:3-oxoacyl-[acyl-carrier protein] reductase/meso-butanediol dehydrogenase/(S,S)-butanediol dehydrogenase/diacetyl reductase